MGRRAIRLLGVLGIVTMLSGATALTAFARPTSTNPNDKPYYGKWIYTSSLPYSDSMDVASATVDQFDIDNYCDSDDPGNTVWYRLRATTSEDLTLDTFGSSYDTEITVFDQQGNYLACNDDADEVPGYPEDPNNDVASYLEFSVEAGHTYLIRVGSYDNPPYCQTEGSCEGVSDSALVFNVNVNDNVVVN